MSKKTKEKSIKESNFMEKSLLIGNIIFLIINIGLGVMNFYDFGTKKKQINIEIKKSMPRFEITYYSIYDCFKCFAYPESCEIDSIVKMNNPFLKMKLLKNNILDLYLKDDKYFNSNYTSDISLHAINLLSIKQCGLSPAIEVEIDYLEITTKNGLDYFASDDIVHFQEMDVDIKNERIIKKLKKISLGDLQPDQGILIPIYYTFSNPNASDMIETKYFSMDSWAKTSNIVYVPIKLRFKNIFDNTIEEIGIRKMLDLPYEINIWIESRG